MTVCSRDPYQWNVSHFIRRCCPACARAGMQGEQEKALCKSCLKAYPFSETTARNTQALAFLLELGSSFIGCIHLELSKQSRREEAQGPGQEDVGALCPPLSFHSAQMAMWRQGMVFLRVEGKCILMHEWIQSSVLVTQFARFCSLNQLISPKTVKFLKLHWTTLFS